MKPSTPIPIWTIAAPIFAGAVLLAAGFGLGGILVAFISLGLAGSVFAAVHHAEVIAQRVGEPYGTLVLALAVTLIEVALIVSLMAAGGEEAAGLARDTVFAVGYADFARLEPHTVIEIRDALLMNVGGKLLKEQEIILPGGRDSSPRRINHALIQKLKRRSCSGPSRQGRPRGLRG